MRSNHYLNNLLKFLHFPLWIIKDGAWFFGFPLVSLFTAIPTLVLSFWLAYKEKGLERYEWTLIGLWLASNTFWMASENFSHSYKEIAKISWSLSFIFLPVYLVFLTKHLRKNNI
jgi:hypothetical protein